MSKKILLGIGLLVILGLLSNACGEVENAADKDALNADSLPETNTVPTTAPQVVTAPAVPPQPVTAPAAEPPAPQPTAAVSASAAQPAASTCDVAREAFLTGSPGEVQAALRTLIADRSADATAREYAQYYLERDKDDPQMQEMDKSLIRMACAS